MNPPQQSHLPRDEQPNRRAVRVGSVRIDLATHSVFREACATVRLSPKAAQVLMVLLAHGDRPVHREQLIARAWPGQFRTDDVVTKAIQELRRALSDNPDQPAIETIPRVGYRLKLPFEWLDDSVALRWEAIDERECADGPTAEDSGSVALAGSGASNDGFAGERPAPASRRIRRGSAGLLLALLVAAAALFAFPPGGDAELASDEPASAPSSLASQQVTPSLDATPLSTDPGDEAYAAISPDGQVVAISARRAEDARYRLYLHDLKGGGERLLLQGGTGDELAPAWSRDGRQLAYFRIGNGECSLELADALGLSSRPLAACHPGMVVPTEFLPDSTAVLVPWLTLKDAVRKVGFARIDLASGVATDFYYGSVPEGFELEARFSPDGSKLLVQQGVPPFTAVHLYALESAPKSAQAPQASNLGERYNAINGMTWLPDNRHVVVASDSAGVMELWRIDTVSGRSERFGGLPGRFPSAARGADALVYSRLDRASGLVEFMPQPDSPVPAQREIFTSTRAEGAPAVAPDGMHLAFVSDRSGSAQVYLGDFSDQSSVRISELDAGQPFDLSFSSDGRELAFSVRRDLETAAWIMDLRTRARREPELGIASTIDLRFGGQPDQLLFTGWDEHGRPHVYTQHQHDPASARRLADCEGRSPRSGRDGWVYFFAPDQRMLKRVREDGSDPTCFPVSDRVRWLNRNAWVADPAGLVAVLGPLDRVARPGLYRLSEPKQLLLELGELARRPLSGIELTGDGQRWIAAMPVAANADVWLVRGIPRGDL